MKRKTCIFIIAMAVAGLSAVPVSAQPQPGSRPEFNGESRPMPDVSELAQKKADAMDRELSLSEKQYKKILKYYKSEIQKERDMMQANRPAGMPDGFSGGRPDFGGGMPPMGGSGFGGPGSGFPGGGFPGGGPAMDGGRAPVGGPGMAVSEEEMDKFYARQDKKLKKILTEEQYSRWRSKHSAIPMPEMFMK